MKIDPAFCQHTNVKKSVKLETMSVPELGIEQLVIRVKAYCGDCKETFIPKTMAEGFSTSEIGVLDNEVFIPLEYPIEDLEEPEMDPIEIAEEKVLHNRDRENMH